MGKKSQRKRASAPPHASRFTPDAAPEIAPPPTVPAAPPPHPSAFVRLGLPALVFALAVAAFAPALRQGFVEWDDDQNFLLNDAYRGLSEEHLRWMFTTDHVGHWQPLSWVTLAVDYELSGVDRPTGALALDDAAPLARQIHRTNLLLHGGTAVLFLFVALGLLRRTALGAAASETRLRLAAAAAALLFAVHPLRVESVAWATERRDVLSGIFLMGTVLVWLRAAGPGRARGGGYAGALALFALSLLSKAWGITLPFVLLVLDVWPLRRWRGAGGALGPRALLAEKVPFFALSVGAAAAAFAAQRAGVGGRTALLDWDAHGPLQRLAQACFGLAFYVRKTLWPAGLSPLYELEVDVDPGAARYVASAAAVAAAVALLAAGRRRWPAGAAAFAVYAVVVSPVLGLVQSGAQSAADRYTYLATLPFALLAGAGLLALARRTSPAVPVAVGAALVALLAVLAWRQTLVWRDSHALWTHVARLQPESYVAHFNLGAIEHRAGRLDVALGHYRRSVECHPGEANDQARLMVARLGRGDDAIAVLEEGLRVAPETWTLIQEIDPRYRARGRAADLAALWEAGIAADPRDYQGHLLYGDLLASLGRDDEALAAWGRALAIEGGDPPMPPEHRGLLHARIAAAHQRAGRLEAAEESWRRALPLSGGSAEVALGLAECLLGLGRAAEARGWVTGWLDVPAGAPPELQAVARRARALEARIRAAGG